MKSALWFLSVIFLFAGIGMTHSDHPSRGAEEILLNGAWMGDVSFPHRKHQIALEEDCMKCHNTFPMEAGVVSQKKKNGEFKKKQIMNGLCLACHKTMKKTGNATGPVSCKKCHKK